MPEQPQMPGQEEVAEAPKKGGTGKMIFWVLALGIIGYLVYRFVLN